MIETNFFIEKLEKTLRKYLFINKLGKESRNEEFLPLILYLIVSWAYQHFIQQVKSIQNVKQNNKINFNRTNQTFNVGMLT